MKTSTPLALATLLLATTVAHGQQPQVVAANQLYGPGAQLTSPLTGVSFTLPDGFQGQWDAEVQAVVIAASAGDALGAIWGWSEATVEEVADGIGGLLVSAGIQVQPRGELEMDENGLRGFFDAMSPQGPGLLYAVIRRGTDGNVVAAGAVSTVGSDERVQAVVDQVIGSVSWATPVALGWRAQVEGTVLSAASSGSDYSSGGGATATGASQSNTTLALCRAGRYQYQSVSETYVSIPGASASSESRDEHAGGWWLVADLAGNASLWLEADDGSVRQWSVQEQSDGFLVDGYRYVVSNSGAC